MKTKFNAIAALLFSLAIATILFLHSCVSSQSKTLTPLRVGINQWPGFDIALYAKEAGLFEQRGLDVQFSLFDVSQDTVRALLRGSLDVGFNSIWELMQADPGNDHPVYIMVTNISAGSDGIVTQSNIESVQALQGKKISAKLGTVSHLILLEALQLHQIKPEAVRIEDVINDIAVERMQDGSLDGAVLWEPALSETAAAIDGHIVFTTADVDSLILDGLATRSSFLASNRETLTQFILAWFDLMHAIETKPTEVFEVVGQQLGQSQESFSKDYAGLKKGDIALNQRMFKPQGRLQETTHQIAQLLRDDPRHNRVVREDVEINSGPVNDAIQRWKP